MRTPAARAAPGMRAPRVFRARDVAPFSPRGADRDYRSRLLVDDESVGSRNLVMNLFTLLAGRGTRAGSHPPPYDEVYYVLQGRGVLTLGDRGTRRHRVGPGSVAFIPAGTVHRLRNTGRTPLDMLTVMPRLPVAGVNPVYDARKEAWGTSFRLVGAARAKKPRGRP